MRGPAALTASLKGLRSSARIHASPDALDVRFRGLVLHRSSRHTGRIHPRCSCDDRDVMPHPHQHPHAALAASEPGFRYSEVSAAALIGADDCVRTLLVSTVAQVPSRTDRRKSSRDEVSSVCCAHWRRRNHAGRRADRGDPLERPDFFEIMDYAKSLKRTSTWRRPSHRS